MNVGGHGAIVRGVWDLRQSQPRVAVRLGRRLPGNHPEHCENLQIQNVRLGLLFATLVCSPVTATFFLLRSRSANHRRAMDRRDAIAPLFHDAANDATRNSTSIAGFPKRHPESRRCQQSGGVGTNPRGTQKAQRTRGKTRKAAIRQLTRNSTRDAVASAPRRSGYGAETAR